jgi:hypothetical protein
MTLEHITGVATAWGMLAASMFAITLGIGAIT